VNASAAWFSLIWSDSAFPAGGASHSSGLEGAIQEQWIRSMDDLAGWMADYVERVLAPCDLAASFLAHRAASREDWRVLFEIDETLHAMKIAREEREVSLMMGRRRLRVIASAARDPRLDHALSALDASRWSAHVATVWGLIGAIGGLSETETARGMAYHALAGMTSAAIRLRLCGQQAAQNLLTRLGEGVAQAIQRASNVQTLEDLHYHAPLLELAQMNHERADVRLFMS
jgi:urease accessory protein